MQSDRHHVILQIIRHRLMGSQLLENRLIGEPTYSLSIERISMQIVLEIIEDSDLGSLDLILSIPAENQHTLAH